MGSISFDLFINLSDRSVYTVYTGKENGFRGIGGPNGWWMTDSLDAILAFLRTSKEAVLSRSALAPVRDCG